MSVPIPASSISVRFVGITLAPPYPLRDDRQQLAVDPRVIGP
jgi:hypothetical protein